MTGQKRELFEAIILDTGDNTGQRGALAFFCVGHHGPTTARRVKSALSRHSTVTKATNLGYAEAEITAPYDRHQFSSEGWADESRAKMATSEWFYRTKGDFIHVLNGDPAKRIRRVVIFAWDMDFLARGCIRTLRECASYYCSDIAVIFNNEYDDDWLSQEVLDFCPGCSFLPSSKARPGPELFDDWRPQQILRIQQLVANAVEEMASVC